MGLLSTAIGIGASLLGGALNRKAASKENAANRAFSEAQFERLQTQSIQDRVADAKKAGVHPLFALGSSVGNASNSVFIPGQSESGSFLGDGLSAAGGALADRGRGSGKETAADRRMDARVGERHRAEVQGFEARAQRDLAEAAYYASQAKLAEHQVLSKGSGAELVPRGS